MYQKGKKNLAAKRNKFWGKIAINFEEKSQKFWGKSQ